MEHARLRPRAESSMNRSQPRQSGGLEAPQIDAISCPPGCCGCLRLSRKISLSGGAGRCILPRSRPRRGSSHRNSYQRAEQKVLIDGAAKTAVHYVLHPQLGTWLKFVTRPLGRMADNHVWILADQVPAFIRFEGPLRMLRPIWQIEWTSPHWRHAKEK